MIEPLAILEDPDELPGLDILSARARLRAAYADGRTDMTAHSETGDPQGQGEVVTMSGEAQAMGDDENPFIRAARQLADRRRLEALLFASPEPMSVSELAERVQGADVPTLLAELQRDYAGRGIELRVVDRRWQFVTAPDVADVLVVQRTQARRLSRAAIETLAIIAYHQPCSRAEIEEVRGVAVAKGSLDQLLELGWIRLRGRRDVPGRPVLYGTTPAFLEHFGLAELGDLPGLADLKAAGLLDARLPPGFVVPTPRSADGDDADSTDAGGAGDNDAAKPSFAADFLSEGDADVDMTES